MYHTSDVPPQSDTTPLPFAATDRKAWAWASHELSQCAGASYDELLDQAAHGLSDIFKADRVYISMSVLDDKAGRLAAFWFAKHRANAEAQAHGHPSYTAEQARYGRLIALLGATKRADRDSRTAQRLRALGKTQREIAEAIGYTCKPESALRRVRRLLKRKIGWVLRRTIEHLSALKRTFGRSSGGGVGQIESDAEPVPSPEFQPDVRLTLAEVQAMTLAEVQAFDLVVQGEEGVK